MTSWYLLIIMMVSITFSAVIYKMLTGEIERFERVQRFRIERGLNENSFYLDREDFHLPIPNIIASPELIKETKERILSRLIMVNFSVAVLSGALGFLLAGKTLRPIKEMVNEQNRFIGDASHEFRTPLTSLKTSLEVFLRDKKSTVADAKKMVKEGIQDVNCLQLLSDQLLQLAQYEKSNTNIQLNKTPLSGVIKEAIRKISPLAKNKDITIKTDLKDYYVKGNFYSLVDLFVTLFDNAVKYSPQSKTVIIKNYKFNRMVNVEIIDQGIGIDKKDIPYIFNRFYRSDRARVKNNIGGYGLGLPIAKEIVDFHNGTIRINSKINKGTTVYISLPFFS